MVTNIHSIWRINMTSDSQMGRARHIRQTESVACNIQGVYSGVSVHNKET